MYNFNSIPRVLYLSESFANWTAPNYHHFQQKVVAKLPGSFVYGPGIRYNSNHIQDIIPEVFGDQSPDAIICQVHGSQLLGRPMDDLVIDGYGLPSEMAVFPIGLEKVSIPKILWIGDFWQCSQQEWDDVILKNGFDIVFSTCCPPFGSRKVFDSFFSDKVQDRVRFVPWPHSFTPEIFKDYELAKCYDITLLGAMWRQFYPLRNAMHDQFIKQDDLHYINRAHPGYRFVTEGNNLVGELYANVLNQSLIFAGCTSIYGIPFQKIYEVMACKSVMMCDRPYGAEYLGFIDRENYLTVTEDNFLETARHYLAHPECLAEIACNAHRLVHSRHTSEIRADEFKDTLTSLLSGKEPSSWASLFSEVRRSDMSWTDPRDAIIKDWKIYRSPVSKPSRLIIKRLGTAVKKAFHLVKLIKPNSKTFLDQ